jgi:bifunctional non-homologous end joining protein LigD
MPTPIPTTTINSASLYFREGASDNPLRALRVLKKTARRVHLGMVQGDNEYHAAIEPSGNGYLVTFAYGRRGSTLNTGVKTDSPVSLPEATKVFEKLVASKTAKGYRPTGSPAPVYQQNGTEGADTGIRCQLLNPVEESELQRLLADDRHCLQEKHDGRRLLVRKSGDAVTGINRRGLAVALPGPIHAAVASIGVDLLLDGEAVGEMLHVFDLLEISGTDLRGRGYLDRFRGLAFLLGDCPAGLSVVATAIEASSKRALFDNCRATGREGVVFKDRDAPFSPGRPASGGPQLKFKFVETASFIVTGRHAAKRSVTLGLYAGDGNGNGNPDDNNRLVSAGNVTIPPNHAVPPIGSVCDIRYLYCMRESGAIYQPVYVGPRDDIPPAECTTDQLKYKANGQ